MNLIDLRERALDGSREAHARVRRELAIYRNEGYSAGQRVGGVYSMAKESIEPKIRRGVNRLIPGFVENMGRIEVLPDSSYRTEEDIQFCGDIQNWLDMNDDATDEGEEMHIAIQQNLSLGNAIRKVGWDAERGVVRADAIHPLSFSVDTGCRKSNLSDAGFVNHRAFQFGSYVRAHYPRFRLKEGKQKGSTLSSPVTKGSKQHACQGAKQDVSQEIFCVDELWMRPAVAREYGVKMDADAEGVVVAVIINDEIHRARLSPYWWPDFPFVHWRNFFDVDATSGLAHSFWGHGYGVQLWNNQKLLDELLANLILISRNQAVGRFISKQGMLDMEQVLPIHGLNIEFPDGYSLSDLMHLPPENLPPDLYHIIERVSGTLDADIPSLSDVFTGEAPFQGASGRAVNALQYAAFSQLAGNIRRMNEFRLRCARIKITMIQQFARQPVRPHLWRGGVDLPERFPRDARHIGYQLNLPESSGLPNTPAGRLQLVQMLQGMGMAMTPERMVEFIGLDKGFGLKGSDFMMAQDTPQGASQGAPVDEEVVSGREAAMKAER